MHRATSAPASSGWEWSAGSPLEAGVPQRRRPPRRRGTAGIALAIVLFAGVASAAVAGGLALVSSDEPAELTASESEPSASPVAAKPEAKPRAKTSATPALPSQEFVWTTDNPTTLKDLSVAWSIPRSVLTQLNPDLPTGIIESGTQVTVYSPDQGASYSVGPPNDGRLIRGVPLPEGRAWLLPENRGRAFATSQTIAALTAALNAYGQKYPDADPIQIGDLSARSGGEIYGHQSHQTGRDVDIRLVHTTAGDEFDAERNWFLVKTILDGSEVRAIFLNRTEQAWMRAAAEQDVGAAQAQKYFELIRHEPGHTIHMHIRYACPTGHTRCVGYSQPDTAEQDPKPKRLSKRGTKRSAGTTKLPGQRPKTGRRKRNRKRKR